MFSLLTPRLTGNEKQTPTTVNTHTHSFEAQRKSLSHLILVGLELVSLRLHLGQLDELVLELVDLLVDANLHDVALHLQGDERLALELLLQEEGSVACLNFDLINTESLKVNFVKENDKEMTFDDRVFLNCFIFL